MCCENLKAIASLALTTLFSVGMFGCSHLTIATPPVETVAPTLGVGQNLEVTAEVKIDTEVIKLEVAQTRQQQALGLMYRPELPKNRGMLFPFPSPRIVTFWMRNVPVPLDMVFLLNGTVKEIAGSVPPCGTPSCPLYGPEEPVNQVIELRSGRARELGLKVGDRLEIRFYPPNN